jgi:hypothetical protein
MAPSKFWPDRPILIDMTIERLVPGFRAETPLERALASDPELLEGLAWGTPRPGHPEGSVGTHVADILRSISETSGQRRRDLRFVALIHDAFKWQVRPELGLTPDNDHAMIARRFAERYTGEQRLLATLELHDEPYRIWRSSCDACTLQTTLDRIDDLALFLRFVELDGSTRGKDPRPLAWLHDVLWADVPLAA